MDRAGHRRPSETRVTLRSFGRIARTPMLRSAPIAVALTALVSWFSIQLRAPEWSGHVPEALETEFSMTIELGEDQVSTGRADLRLARQAVGVLVNSARFQTASLQPAHRLHQAGRNRSRRSMADANRRMFLHTPGAYGSRAGFTLKGDNAAAWTLVRRCTRWEPAGPRRQSSRLKRPRRSRTSLRTIRIQHAIVYGTDATATLVVRNGSREVLRIVQPGQKPIHRARLDARRWTITGVFEVPWQTLSDAAPSTTPRSSVDRLGWDSIGRLTAGDRRTRCYVAFRDPALTLARPRSPTHRGRTRPVDRTADIHRRARRRMERFFAREVGGEGDDKARAVAHWLRSAAAQNAV
jgi:hypothetical protein